MSCTYCIFQNDVNFLVNKISASKGFNYFQESCTLSQDIKIKLKYVTKASVT